ncbi:MAG: hypothetical protein H8E28_05100 [Anaerolineae bacterium]|nr:hypothetical protein [Anaerolineae bacterium]MBL6966141.1 hypothetical protein [Anaerolineales bacterium]
MPNKHQIRFITIMAMLAIGALACSLITPQSPDIESAPTSAVAESTPEAAIAPTRATAAASESAPPAEGEAPPEAPASTGDIQPAAAPAIPDCNALDIAAFNAIVNDTFNFVIQDQLNNCHYATNSGYNLMLGGGKPASLGEIKDLFDSTFGALPNSTWEAIDDFYLGMAFSSVTVTAQGISASGHTLMIVAAGEPDGDPAALQTLFTDLAKEAARQLNQQF